MDVKEYCRQFNKKYVRTTNHLKVKVKENEEEEDEDLPVLTPEEIKARCLEIQQRWTDEDRKHRSRGLDKSLDIV
jgi:hypothetical protein